MRNKRTYNAITFAVFAILLVATFTFFSQADDTNLTLFEDFDRDGVSNGEEEVLGTNPRVADTDGDGYTDGVELESGYNPLIPAPGDRIVTKTETVQFNTVSSQTDNVTQKIAEDVVSYIADAQESGVEGITSEEFSQVISEAVDKEVSYAKVDPVDISEISIKEQDYDDLSDNEREEQMKNDAVEYLTAVSYVFVTNFPNGFFDRSVEEFQSEFMAQMTNFSDSLTSYGYFEDLAENAISAESQLEDITVPEEMLEIHTQGIYLLRYMEAIYDDGSYKSASTDITPMVASLAQIQELLNASTDLQTLIQEKLTKYELEDIVFDL